MKNVLYMRWMIRRDMPQVLAIEQEAFEFPWSEDDFVRCMRIRNVIGLVAESNEQVIGYILYEICQNRLHILNIAVSAENRRKGVGRAILDHIKAKLDNDVRSRLLLEVRERNLPAQMFFRSQGFQAISVVRNYYEDSTEDAYVMRFRTEATKEVSHATH